MQELCRLHPIIYKIEDGGDDNYKVFEKVKVGPFSYAFTYPAKVSSNESTGEVKINAVVQRFTKIEMHFMLSESCGITNIAETIKISSPLPIKSVLKKVFTEQHHQLFENIKNSDDLVWFQAALLIK